MNPALALLLLLGVGAAQASMPVDRLRAAAEAAAPFSPATASLDPRVQVARCSGPLLTELTSVQPQQATVQIRCAQPRWQLYVPVRATGDSLVVVLKRSIPAQAVIQASDVEAVTRDRAALGYGAFGQLDEVIGQQTRRALPAGRVLGPGDVLTPPMIRRGDHVALELQTATVRIRMAGEALTDGAFGQRIAVRNRSSGKRIEGIVRSAGAVEIPH